MQFRANLTASHDRVWQQLAQPGTWLSGRERVAVAAELRAARHCTLCAERKAALSPNSVHGDHQAANHSLRLPDIEIVHRLTTDPGRITRTWVDGLLADGLQDVRYVEIAALVSAVTVVDTFHAAMGLALRPLPDPLPGEPTQVRPRTAADEGAYVAMIAADALADDYLDLYDSDHWVPNVHRAFSLVPAATRCADDLMQSHYFPYEQVPRYSDGDHDYAINKMQIELLAARVSRYNNCFY